MKPRPTVAVGRLRWASRDRVDGGLAADSMVKPVATTLRWAALACFGLVVLVAPFEGTEARAALALRAVLVLAGTLVLVAPGAPRSSVAGASGVSARRWAPRVPGLALLAWFGLECLSASGLVHRASPFEAWGRVGDIGLVVGAYFVARALSEEGTANASALRWLVALAAVLPAARAGMEFFGLVTDDGSGRASYPYANANLLAGLFDLTLPMAVALALFGRGRARACGLALSVLLVIGLAATYSRGGQVATSLAVFVLVAVWVLGPEGPPRAVRVLVALVLGAAVASSAAYFLVSSPRVRGDLVTRLERSLDLDQSTSTRLAVWRGALILIRENPSLGVGPGQVGNSLVTTRPSRGQSVVEQELRSSIGHAHNDALEVATEAGLPAALAFLAFWLVGLLRLFDRNAPGRALRVGSMAGLAALLIHGLVDVNLSLTTANALLAAVIVGTGSSRP